MGWPGHRFAFALFTTVIVLWLGAMIVVMHQAALPADSSGTMLVVFEPGTESAAAFSAITRANARPIRKTAFGFIWVVYGESGALLREGAIGTYRDLPLPAEIAGCVAVVDDKATEFLGF